jgi:tRNA threonylcarbamoyladenosine biosynthesis protein TsaE
MILELNSLEDLPRVAKELIAASQEKKVWLFDGEMGAGKTTLIKTICKELGVEETISSPTFSIVNEYEGKEGQAVYHFDFYRLKNEEEAMDIGVEEYLYSGDYCLIEWPSVVPGVLPDDCFKIEIIAKDEYLREVHIS